MTGAGERRSVVFARQVRRLRELREWSQADLARRLNEIGRPLGQSRVSAIEANGSGVTIDQAEAIARALDYPLAGLLSLDEDRTVQGWVAQVELADERVRVTVEQANRARQVVRRVLAEEGLTLRERPADYLNPIEIRSVQPERAEAT
ncbi:MAG: helix-turn-helix transcriptional regulator [Frankiaceae bacterium]